MIFVKTNAKNETFGKLCEKYQNMSQLEDTKPCANVTDMQDVVLLYYHNQAMGCGSYKYWDENTAEFDYIYLDKSVRNRTTIQLLLFRLEDNAKHAGYQYAVYTLSKFMQNGIDLFKELGYTIIPNYGYYANVPNAVCLKKKLI